ncbi:MAG TPA: 30S ribosomal protein S4e [Candidatus Nanoarchaeia archaeon]|nr:30S ribosomal protein S4e [Candidatus Nanoarchaeia archaeon]
MPQHLSRARTPNNWPIKRKATKWITRINPGAHPIASAINLNLLLKAFLKYATTSREVRSILNQKIILIDKKPRTNPKFSIGVMDLIEVTKTKEAYRLILDERGNFKLIPVKQESSSLKPCKIINKQVLHGNKTQLNLYDGRNILSEDKSLKVNDTIILDVTTNKIQGHLKFAKNSTIYLTAGKNAGTTGILKDIYAEKSMLKPRILLDTGKEKIETLKAYAFVIDPQFIEPAAKQEHGTKHNEADQSK